MFVVKKVLNIPHVESSGPERSESIGFVHKRPTVEVCYDEPSRNDNQKENH